VAIKEEYFALLHKALIECPFVYVRKSDAPSRKHFYPVFHRDGVPVDVPPAAGIYLIYRKHEDRPFYCGESRSLYRRIEYHFSDDPNAIRDSTLKKYFSEDRKGLVAMSKDLRFRFVEVPFGRRDFEEFLHEHYQLNTRKKKGPNPESCVARSWHTTLVEQAPPSP
jgi:hypothetical protein